MTTMETIVTLVGAILGAAGVPSALFASYLRRVEKRRAKEEETRRTFELYQVKMLTATAALCEANAIALQNGKCNGETHKALDHLKEVKHDQRDFLVSQGLDHIF